MESLDMCTRTWAQHQFGTCDLGDQRRTQRLVSVAGQVANNPSASFPQQMETWGDLKAAYRLFDSESVTFEMICQPHWQTTQACGTGRYLILGDTTEIDFGIRREIEGLGPTGNGRGYGFLVHSGLMVDADSERIIGLSAQTIHYRKPVAKNETASQRMARDRESQIWGKVIDQTGPPPEGAEWVHVLDRGADNFEVFCHLQSQHAHWVVRASQLHRNILTPSGEKTALNKYINELPVAGVYTLKLRTRPRQPARTAQLEVRYGPLSMPEPMFKSPYVKQRDGGPIAMSVIEVREVNAPPGVTPITWVLYTSLAIRNFEEARTIIGYYEKRWLIEDYHKALKTGCRVEDRQLKSPARLEAMLGVLAVVAVRLLQLKSVARTDPDRPAKQVVPQLWIAMLIAVRKLPRRRELTVHQFYRELAKLGGFLGRKSDGQPGWITLWHGWEKLNLMIRGHDLLDELQSPRQKCG